MSQEKLITATEQLFIAGRMGSPQKVQHRNRSLGEVIERYMAMYREKPMTLRYYPRSRQVLIEIAKNQTDTVTITIEGCTF